MPQDFQTAAVESNLLTAAAMLAAGTGQFQISNDPTLQAQDVAAAMRMKWEMARSYYAALVGALSDQKDWTPPVLDNTAIQVAAQTGAVPRPVIDAIMSAAQVAVAANPSLALPAAIAQVVGSLIKNQQNQPAVKVAPGPLPITGATS